MCLRQPAALVGRWQPSIKSSHLYCHLRRRRPPPPLSRNFHASKPIHSIFQTSTDYAYNTLTFIHDYSGLPWALSIPITAILLRSLFTLPAYYLIFLNRRKMDMGEPLREAYRNASIRKVREAAKHAEEDPPSNIKAMNIGGNSKVTMLFSKKLRYNPYVAMLPVLYSPVWCSCFQVLAGMSSRGNPSAEEVAAFPVFPYNPSLASEGLLWFPDLTAFDPLLCAVFVGLLIKNAASGGFQGLRLMESFPTAHGWPRFKYSFYRYSSTVISAAVGIKLFTFYPPAALVLFCVSSSACALVQRGLMRKWIGESKNTIMPARPREMKMRRVVAIDADGIPSYGKSSRVPKEFDDLFERTQIRDGPDRTQLTSESAQPIAQKPSHRV